jgi:hypothetical protein
LGCGKDRDLLLRRKQDVELTVHVHGQGLFEPSEGIPAVCGHLVQFGHVPGEPGQGERVRGEDFDSVTGCGELGGHLA